jgi:hypothetical protein
MIGLILAISTIILIIGLLPAAASMLRINAPGRLTATSDFRAPGDPVGNTTNALDTETGDLVRFNSRQVADEVRFQKQCFLSYNLLRIHDRLQTTAQASLPGGQGLGNRLQTNFRALKAGFMTRPVGYTAIRGAYPADITSLFVAHKDIQPLLELKPALLSFLVPYVRFYKVFYTDDGSASTNAASNMSHKDNGEEVEFVFDDVVNEEDVSAIFRTHSGRAGGVGLRSFSWEFLGVNPAEVENNIRARLSLFFNDMKEFERERDAVETGSNNWKYRFSDLVVPEPMYNTPADSADFRWKQRTFNPNFFRLKVVAGWAIKENPPSNVDYEDIFFDDDVDLSWEDFVELTKVNRKVMYLNLISHDINFDHDGSMSLTAEYQAYAEGIFSSPETDIISPHGSYYPNLSNDPAHRGTVVEDLNQRVEQIDHNLRVTRDLARGDCAEQFGPSVDLRYTDEDGNTLTQSVSTTRPRDPQAARDQDEILRAVRNQLSSRRAEILNEIAFYNRVDRGRAYEMILEKLNISNRIYRVIVSRDALGFGGRETNQEFVETASESEVTEDLLSEDVLNNLWVVDNAEEAPDSDPLGAEERRQAGDRGGEHDEELSQADIRRIIAVTRFAGDFDFDVIDSYHLLVPSVPADPTGQRRGREYNQVQGFDPVSVQSEPQRYISGVDDALFWGLTPDDSLVGNIWPDNSWQQRALGWHGGNQRTQDSADFSEDWSEADHQEALDRLKRFVQWPDRETHRSVGIDFMFLGDILDAVLDTVNLRETRPGHVMVGNAGFVDHEPKIKKWLEAHNVVLMLGTFLYNDPDQYRNDKESKPTFVSLADIPISVELFMVWFIEEIIEKNRDKMTLREFISSIFDKLLISSFGSECVLDPKGKFTLVQESISPVPEFYTVSKNAFAASGLDINNHTVGRTAVHSAVSGLLNKSGVSLLDYEPGLQYENYKNIILYQAKGMNAWGDIFENDFSGTPYLDIAVTDIRNGVYHLNIGSDRGLVKTITFNRMDQTYLREARIEQAGELGSFGQLRERYNATVSLYGNMLFYPGQYIYINPSMVGLDSVVTIESLTTKLGIGGYFLITKVENIVEVGNFETILTCSWVYSGFQIDFNDKACDDGAAAQGRNQAPGSGLDLRDLTTLGSSTLGTPIR